MKKDLINMERGIDTVKKIILQPPNKRPIREILGDKKYKYIIMDNLCCGCRILARITYRKNCSHLDPTLHWKIIKKVYGNAFIPEFGETIESNNIEINKCSGCEKTGRRGFKDIFMIGIFETEEEMFKYQNYLKVDEETCLAITGVKLW